MAHNNTQLNGTMEDPGTHPAIKEALEFLLDEAYRHGNAQWVKIIKNALRKFYDLENGKNNPDKQAEEEDVNQAIMLLREFFTLEEKKRDRVIHQLLQEQ